MSKALFELIKARAKHRCEYCRLSDRRHKIQFEFEHIIAKKHGGRRTRENLAYSCYHCNRHKGPNLTGIDPQSSPRKPIPLFNPRIHRWPMHFEISGVMIIGKTAIGRATINVLNMNSVIAMAYREEVSDEKKTKTN